MVNDCSYRLIEVVSIILISEEKLLVYSDELQNYNPRLFACLEGCVRWSIITFREVFYGVKGSENKK